VVIPVNQQVEQEGITVGVTEVTLTGKEVTVGYWLDCGPHRLEPTKPLVLVVDDETISGSGGGGTLCDPSHIWHRTFFPPLLAGVERFSLQHGAIIGSSDDEIVLELPLGDRLSELDPAFGGELELDLLVESGDLAYRFTKLSMGIDRFTLDLEPASEATHFRPLSGPRGELVVEDDQGNQYRGGGGPPASPLQAAQIRAMVDQFRAAKPLAPGPPGWRSTGWLAWDIGAYQSPS
jgi:hypothetical protein